MITINASAWAQAATFHEGTWRTPDALIGRFLNASCVPASKLDADAVALVRKQFAGIEVIDAAADAMPAAAD